jgi:concanavalin A-like lectin/glucanase superfamily protein
VAFFDDQPTGSHAQSTSATIATGVWVHIAARWDGATQQATSSRTTRSPASAGTISRSNVGADFEFGAPVLPIRGWLDDFRIYDRALTDPEVRRIVAGD